MVGGKKQIAGGPRANRGRCQHVFEAHGTASLQVQGPGYARVRLEADGSSRFGCERIGNARSDHACTLAHRHN